MRKLRSDSKWCRLEPKQREEVLNWLFNEGVGFEEARERAYARFGYDGSVGSVRRFYHHVAEERRLGELVTAAGSVADFRAASQKLLGAVTLKVAMNQDSRKESRQLVSLMKLLLKDQERELSEKRLDMEFQRMGMNQNTQQS